VSITRRYTIADLEQMTPQNGERLELIDGELYVSHQPSWEHQHAASQIHIALGLWSQGSRLGNVMAVPGLVFSDSAGVIPDVIWISWERLRVTRDRAGHFTRGPELVVEVVSPGAENARRDREIKLDLYAREGVEEYWIVDQGSRTVDVYRRQGPALPHVGTLGEDDVLTSPDLLPGFELTVSTIWPPEL
jgi:Uma2 family endonuclease